MLPISSQTKVFLARGATDMRKSFRGLVSLTEAVLRKNPTSGHLFVFINRRRDMIKILHWDGTGFWIWYKQLQRGTFQVPDVQPDDPTSEIEMSVAHLSLMLDGIDLRCVKQRLRYRAPSSEIRGQELSPV